MSAPRRPDGAAGSRARGAVPPHDVVVLAGGAARRLGGVSKAEVVVAGRQLLDHVLDATSAARHVVVVGPPHLARPGVPTVLEHPASGGPVAGIDAGLDALDRRADPGADAGASAGTGVTAGRDEADEGGGEEPAVLVLACDVPQAALVVPRLLAGLAAHPGADGARLVDADGHAQLVVAYRRAPLRRALAELLDSGGVHGVSVRRLEERLAMLDVADPEHAGADADTWHDVRTLDQLISGRRTVGDETVGDEPARDQAAADQVAGDRAASEHAGAGGPNRSGSPLHQWVATLVEELDVAPDAVDVDLLLDLARDVAHQVARPAVPVTTFLLGFAVAAGGADRAALERLTARVSALSAERADAPRGETR